jgi:hypothetical protein
MDSRLIEEVKRTPCKQSAGAGVLADCKRRTTVVAARPWLPAFFTNCSPDSHCASFPRPMRIAAMQPFEEGLANQSCMIA